MNFPFIPTSVGHKHGGKVIEITGIGHETDKPEDGRSRDYWHFFGDVKWSDGTESKGLEIAPWALCSDGPEADAEIGRLLEALSAYLAANGEWCDSKSKHEGWYAHRKNRRAA